MSSPLATPERIIALVGFFVDCCNNSDSEIPQGWTFRWQGSRNENRLLVQITDESFDTVHPYLKNEEVFKDRGKENTPKYIGQVCSACIKELGKYRIAFQKDKENKDTTKIAFPTQGTKSFTLVFASKDKDAILAEVKSKLNTSLPTPNKELENPPEQKTAKSRKKPIPSNLPPSGAYNFFVGRSEMVEDIHEFFHVRAQKEKKLPRLALHGMPGSGKSEIARQYADQYIDTYKGGVVFIDARGDEEREDGILFDDMLHIAKQLTLFIVTCVDESLANEAERLTPFKFLQKYWTRWPNQSEPVLIILDDLVNYDNADHTLDEILPPQYLDRFKILITTRKRFSPSLQYFEVNPLSQFDSYELLSRLLPDGDSRLQLERPTAYAIIDFLEYLPLGIELTGRYLFSKPNMQLSKALDDLKREKLRAEELLKSKPGAILRLFKKWWKPGKEHERDRDMTGAWGVYAALQLSWEVFLHNSRAIAYTLSLYAAHPIPKLSTFYRIFKENCSGCDGGPSLEFMRPEFSRLLKQDFINGALITERGLFLDIHQLVREFFVSKFEELARTNKGREEVAYYQKDFCREMSLQLYEHALAIGFQDRMRSMINLPHVIEAIRIGKEHPDAISRINLAYKLQSVGNYYYEEGSSYNLSLSYMEEALSTAVDELMLNKSAYLDIKVIHKLYTSFEYFEERLSLMDLYCPTVKVLPDFKQHINRITKLITKFNNLYAKKYQNSRDSDMNSSEIESVLTVLDIEKRYFFSTFADTLGDTLEIADAVQNFRELEEGRGKELVEIIDEQGNVRFTVSSGSETSSRSNASVRCIRMIAESREQRLPPNSLKRVATLLKLAQHLAWHESNYNYQESIEAYEKALNLVKVYFPGKSYLIEYIVAEIAQGALDFKVYDKAEYYYKQISAKYQEASGIRFDAIFKLAQIYAAQENYELAIETILAEFDSMFLFFRGQKNSELKNLYKVLADYCLLADRLDDYEHYRRKMDSEDSRKGFRREVSYFLAERWQFIREQDILKEWENDLNEFYNLFTNTANESENLHKLVQTIVQSEYFSQTITWYDQFPHQAEMMGDKHLNQLARLIKQILDERREIHGTQSARYCSTLYKAAQIFSLAGNLRQALAYYEEAIPLIGNVLYKVSTNPNDELFVIVCKNAAEISFKLKNYEKAITHLRSFIPAQAAWFNSRIWNVHESLLMLAQCLLALNRDEEAINPLKIALAIAMDRRVGGSKEVNEPIHLLVQIFYKSNRIDEAISLISDLEIKFITENGEFEIPSAEYEVYRVLAEKYIRDGRLDNALSFLEQAISLNQPHIVVGVTETELQELQKKKAEILDLFGRINSAITEINLGVEAIWQKRYKEAYDLFKSAINSLEDDKKSYICSSKTQQLLKKAESAMELCQMAFLLKQPLRGIEQALVLIEHVFGFIRSNSTISSNVYRQELENIEENINRWFKKLEISKPTIQDLDACCKLAEYLTNHIANDWPHLHIEALFMRATICFHTENREEALELIDSIFKIIDNLTDRNLKDEMTIRFRDQFRDIYEIFSMRTSYV